MKTVLTTAAFLVSSASAASAIEAQVSATYNTTSKTVSPTVTVSHRLGDFRVSGWANFRKSTYKASTSSFTQPAAYTIQDAADRFGITTPSNYTSPDVSGSLYSWDGTRLDGQPISGTRDNSNVTIKAEEYVSETLVTTPVVPETQGVTYGADVKYDVYKDHTSLAALGVGIKMGGKTIPYVTAQAETKLVDAISFFADVKVPFDNSGMDISSGIKIDF